MAAPTIVLGVSALYHDAAAAVVVDGEVRAAVQQERLSRRKHDPALPADAIGWCLSAAGVAPGGLTAVAFYEKPFTALDRVLKTYAHLGARGLRTFPDAISSAIGNHAMVGYRIDRVLRSLGHPPAPRHLYAEHHLSHAAAAFFASPFDDAAVLTFDGVGEWATSSIGVGRGARIDLLDELRYPASIGLLYSAFTAAAGFRVNGGEYKLMGLAPFGRPTYRDRILDELIDLREDGSFTVDLASIGYLSGRTMTTDRFHDRFGGPPRHPDEPITRRECDLARSIQDVVEEIVLRVAQHAHRRTGADRAVLGGGVALNCVANGRLRREGPFQELWVQPAPGDAGSALGCALWATHEVLGVPRPAARSGDAMRGSLLGPKPLEGSVTDWLTELGRPHRHLPEPEDRATEVARVLAAGAVVGVCRGPSEFGPRALGNRSILSDPRDPTMRRRLNASVKRRESFRPFAPVVLEERAAEWFDLRGPSPYMSFVAPVLGAEPVEVAAGDQEGEIELAELLDQVRSPLPAVTHLDGSARVQTVDRSSNPELRLLLEAFERATGCPVLVNTSFNLRGEPIVASAADAYRCFMATDIDWLLLDDCLLAKPEQPPWTGPPPVTVPD